MTILVGSLDLSITKTSNIDNNYQPILTYNFDDSKILESQEIYEIEIELDNAQVGPDKIFHDADKLEQIIKKNITHVLSGLQGTNYPISYPEQTTIKEDYLKLILQNDHLVQKVMYQYLYYYSSSY